MTKAELLAEQSRLLALANELARRHWGVDYTGSLRLVSREWTCYNAKYRYKRDRTDMSLQEIVMSVRTNARRGAASVAGSLLHELVHWRLHTSGLPCSDENDEFIVECLRVGAPISGAASAQKAYQRYLLAEREAA
jgi:SprT-like protein